MKIMRLYLSLLILVFTPIIAFSAPIPPQPLRMLCESSELIVVANVGPSEEFHENDDDDNSPILFNQVELMIQSVLKGDLNESTVTVHVNLGRSCSAPPDYREGTITIAFLNYNKDGEYFVTNGVHYGTKTLSESDREIYIARIRELTDIFQIEDKEQQDRETVEWLVRCTEEPATCWEGAIEISFITNSSSINPDANKLKEHLTEEHYARMMNAFLRTKEFSYEESYLFSLIKNKNDDRLAPFIINYLHSVYQQSQDNLLNSELKYSSIEQLMWWLANKRQNDSAREVTNKFNDISGDEIVDEKQRIELLQDFLLLIEQ